MAEKKDTPVIINGKVYTLSGYESEEYLQSVALPEAECRTPGNPSGS